jgi:dTMP kinase
VLFRSPVAIGQQLVDTKEKRDYLKAGTRDIHEADLDHLRQAEKVYLGLTRTLPNAKLIECARDGQIMSRAAIAELVWQEVKKII